MVEKTSGSGSRRVGGPGILVFFLALAGAVTSAHALSGLLPPRLWWQAVADTNGDVPMLIFMHVALPRIVIAWCAGAALGLAGVLLQAGLRNPMADTTTLGTASGAYLALAVCSVYAPNLLDHGQGWVALAGSATAGAIVLAIGRGAGFTPITVILAGLTLNLLCGSLGAALTILNHETLNPLFVWQGGSLAQNGWGSAATLLPLVALGGMIAALIARPLANLHLGDEHARSVGVPAGPIRLMALGLAIALGAFTVSAVGVIGFIGLAAGHLARHTGARTLAQRLLWAPAIGAALLWSIDQVVQQAGTLRSGLPTGSAAALLGAPLLLWIMMRLRHAEVAPPRRVPEDGFRTRRPPAVAGLLVGLLCTACVLALVFGRNADGWGFLSLATAPDVLIWRAPRVVAALAAGVLLAVAGTLMQRMTGNPMASPEMLGVSSGAALGVIVLLYALPGFHRPAMMLAAFAGAAVTLGVIVAINWRWHFAPERLLLAGVALATLFSGVAAMLLMGGDPRTAMLLAWMSGSTYWVTTPEASMAIALALATFLAAMLSLRWLELLPLGTTARSLGVDAARSRLVLLAIAAAATASATLVVGPLSFIGLMAPHIAQRVGMKRALHQLVAAAAIGGSLLLAADWAGRTLLFPWQMPAGLVSAVFGGPLFLFLLWARR
ncbi:Fe(3+)-hydroxamate ABC transporter permease FhuB [Ancylobacter sp. MQZ15Z-1]|uniref:Fe(3+)-hydroxamate ABC transporter permease FhuB n=1 Tax=Ancylobacter mangrovi TaxID=2972472 RepID=A0A9X2PH05_9HYPH|nr:Fe(3+)-hydroxamate ABC transporter permease FhuB [Ancylobacter mangrovi]MCS0496906.1 Fe(3+)-hydroxamate ABC transporter permease FhuB [Ancylobacter mangrovi]